VAIKNAALSSVGLTELVHGIYRAPSPEIRIWREAYLRELLNNVTVYPYTQETAWVAGQIDGRQRAMGITVPFGDLLIGATALSIGFSVLTSNARHFRLIPGLTVVPF
jgi:predicted nucleic acid-binding protein